MQRNTNPNRAKIGNLLWYAASLMLAFFIWMVATTQADPIEERRLPQQIQVQVINDPGVVVVEPVARNVVVTLRAQQSVLSALTSEDIIVRADLTGMGPGRHTVDLETILSRRAHADTQPRVLTVVLEEVQTQQVEVRADILSMPPPVYNVERIRFTENQVRVSGAASKVEEVVAVEVELDLSNQRSTLETDMRLIPVDANGAPVADVTLEPQSVDVTVEIVRREDVREVFITPNIDVTSLPEGFVLSSINFDPKTVLIVGSQDELAALPDRLFTERIDLAGRTEDFEISVPLAFPDQPLPLLGNQNITVIVNIAAQTANRQFEDISVNVIGLANDQSAQISPDQVTVLVTGPQSALEAMVADDIRVVVDVQGLTPGTYELTAVGSSRGGQVRSDDISILPATVAVTITDNNAVSPTATP